MGKLKVNTARLVLKILLLVMIFNIQFPVLQAQNELSDSIVNERIRFIENTLELDMVKTKRWWYGWLAGYSAATVVQGAVYLGSSDKSTRQDMALGAATTFLGAAGQFISPFIPGKLPKTPNLMSGNSASERLKNLAIGEELFRISAEREHQARSWKSHILCTSVNLGSGLVTWLGFDRSIWAGIGNFALNTVITETQIWSQPMLARRNYLKYQENIMNGNDELTQMPKVNWHIGVYTYGVGFKVVF